MKKLLTYEEYMIFEAQRIYSDFKSQAIDAKKSLFEALSKSPHISEEERLLAEAIVETEQWNALFEGTLNEESIADKLKAKAKAAIQVAKEKGKEYLSDTQEAIMKIGGSVSALIQKILGVVKAFIQKAWDFIKGEVEKGYGKMKDKITEAAKGKFHGKADIAKEEVKNLGSMAKSTAKWFGGIAGEMGSGLNQAASANEGYSEMLETALYLAASDLIVESYDFVQYLKESDDHGHGIKIPFLSALVHKVADFQPFKSLHNVEHAAGSAANNGLNGISSMLSKVAKAPGPFEFTVVGAVFALVTGYAIKAGLTHIVHEIGASALGAMICTALPGLGVVLLCMKYTAKGLWVVGVCETAIGIVKDGGKHEDHEEEDKEKNDEEE